MTPIEGKLSDGPKCHGCRSGIRYPVYGLNSTSDAPLTYHICPVCDWPPGGRTNGAHALEAYYDNKRD